MQRLLVLKSDLSLDPLGAAAAAGTIKGYIDLTSAWEDPANPGKFLPNYTTDGTHPIAAGHIAGAAIVTTYANAHFFP